MSYDCIYALLIGQVLEARRMMDRNVKQHKDTTPVFWQLWTFVHNLHAVRHAAPDLWHLLEVRVPAGALKYVSVNFVSVRGHIKKNNRRRESVEN